MQQTLRPGRGDELGEEMETVCFFLTLGLKS